MRFSVSPRGGASGWAEWLRAMRLVARLPAGVPVEFRRKLWLTLAEQHLKVKGVDWTKAEKICFSEWTNPDDTELGVQIVKDLHRTGCSLFCGSEGRENQAVLKRVLLAYARWNKAVGYCQGFNMLAALILEVMDRSESDSLKVMIYLIEAVLPEGYFANNLRGLSVDMAVFRDLLRLRLPRLSAHLDKLQKGAAEGSVYEPPLTNVFTMQWFLTLFCNCLPHDTVLRVWDLAFLEGDAVLLTTALAIWDTLQDRILKVESADEFYSVMGELARETLEAPPGKGEQLLATAARLGPVPELPKLRDKHRYNIAPWAHTVQSAAKKGLRLFYSEDETDSSDDGDKLALTTAYGLQSGGNSRGRSALVAAGVFGHPDRERLALDISALKQQYERLRERQRQAHIILAAACARQPHVGVSSPPGPMSMNHLLLGKNAIVSTRGRRLGPPQGAIPPSRAPKTPKNVTKSSKTKTETLHWKDENSKKENCRRDSIKWRDVKQLTTQSDETDELYQDYEGEQITESEINEIMKSSMRTRRKSESSTYSECSESSTSTSLCDEPNRMSDFDSEALSVSDNFVGFEDESTLDSGTDKERNDHEDIRSDTEVLIPSEKTDSRSEFGAYVQECENLLDRTNNMVFEKGLICVLPEQSDDPELQTAVHEPITQFKLNLPDALNTEHKDGNFLTTMETIPIITDISKPEDIVHTEQNVNKFNGIFENSNTGSRINSTSAVEIENANEIKSVGVNIISTEETNDLHMKLGEKEKNVTEDDIDNDFFEFVDSNRGKQLRSYLNEFKIADTTNKLEFASVLEYTEPCKFEVAGNVTSYFNPNFQCDDTDVLEIANVTKDIDMDDTTIKAMTSIDGRSTSCDRSVSSSLSSISPILRTNTGFVEEKPTFMSYKSPCRDSDVPSEFSEDEKPLVLKIDKYFEHSPEFFGARKSGSYVSSDEEDDKVVKKNKSEPYTSTKSEHSPKYKDNIYPDYKTKSQAYRKKSHDRMYVDPDECDEVFHTVDKQARQDHSTADYIPKYDFLHSPKSQPESSFSIYQLPEPSRHRRISSLDSPQAAKYITNRDFENADKDSKYLKGDQHTRFGLLEKTKSEELPRDQKLSFSVLDDEIDAIRSQSGRRNSERALKIIQENSKILHRILVNQVNKCSARDSFQEETSEELPDDISEALEKTFAFPQSKLHKYLLSPRSTSLDDHLLKTKDSFALPTSSFTLEMPRSPTQTKTVSPLTPNKSTTLDDITRYKDVTTNKYSPARPKSFESSIYRDEKRLNEKLATQSEELQVTPVKINLDENKTDMFGWENKGFGAKQRKSSIGTFTDEKTSPKPKTHLISDLIDHTKNIYGYDYNKDLFKEDAGIERTDRQCKEIASKYLENDRSIIVDVKLHLEPAPVSSGPESPAIEKNSSLTAVSDTLFDIIDNSSRDITEANKFENNDTAAVTGTGIGTYNLSPPYKITHRSSDVSTYLEESLKSTKISDLSFTRVSDSFSRVTECSPIDTNSRPEGHKFETSQSSDMFVISSSMSFSFEPSVDDQPSSKPATFNSSDTLCQLTSLDQVSTPISPKATSYSLGKDSIGISQRDLSLELDRFRLASEDNSYKPNSYTDTYSGCAASLRTPSSPTPSYDRSRPIKSPDKDRGKSILSPEKAYSPFPGRILPRHPKELGLRLGLYKDPIKSPSK